MQSSKTCSLLLREYLERDECAQKLRNDALSDLSNPSIDVGATLARLEDADELEEKNDAFKHVWAKVKPKFKEAKRILDLLGSRPKDVADEPRAKRQRV